MAHARKEPLSGPVMGKSSLALTRCSVRRAGLSGSGSVGACFPGQSLPPDLSGVGSLWSSQQLSIGAYRIRRFKPHKPLAQPLHLVALSLQGRMILTDSDSSIDTSVWLPRDASVVKAERVAKGDIDCTVRDGRIATATVYQRTLLTWLVKHEVIEHVHEYFAMGFLELQHCFLSETRYKSNSIFLAQALGSTESGRHADTLYLIVCKLLQGPRVAVIHRATSAPSLPDGYEMPQAARTRYRDAFVALVDAMEEGMEILKRRIEAESAPGVEQ